jgi:SAM-dependent methyltransferase
MRALDEYPGRRTEVGDVPAMHREARTWLRKHGEALMRRLGVREGDVVLDFGCRDGRYAVPAARVVGPEGFVHALDKDRKALTGVRQIARKQGLANLRARAISNGRLVPLPQPAPDVALLFDVLHGGYFPKAGQRKALLAQLYRVLRPGGLLVCYLTHVKQFGLTFGVLLGEIRATGFRLKNESRRRLVHDDNLVRGRVLRFRKPRRRPRDAQRRPRRSP